MILLQSVVQVYVGPMPNRFTQFAPNRRRIGIMTIGRDPVRDNPGHRSGGTEKRFGGGEIASLAEHHVHQGAIAIDGPIEVTPVAVHFDESLVHVPATADVAASTATEFLSQTRGEFRLPI